MYSQRRPSSRPPRNGGGGYSSQRGRSTSSPGRNFESNGPANFRVRGKPIQIHDKYVQLARDSAANGDKILTENLLQHAEHYLRMQNFERDKSAPERSPERSSDSGEEEGDGGYRRFAPRSTSARRRWAVAPEGPAREGYASSEPASSTGEQSADSSTDIGEEQAQVEQRRPLSEGGLQTADAPASASNDDSNDDSNDGGNNNGNNNERGYSSEASYD